MLNKELNDNELSVLYVVACSVLEMNVDAIVNAANTSLLGDGGIDGAIHRAAGPDLLKECRSLNGCRTGKTKVTQAYGIKNVKFFIHTVGPVYTGIAKDKMDLTFCYNNCLNLAFEIGCKSIAFPDISTGVYGYTLSEAVPISVNAVSEWLKIMKKLLSQCISAVLKSLNIRRIYYV